MATEADYTKTIVEALQYLGWLCAHHPDSRRLVGDRGMPDIVAVRHGRLVFVELKTRTGRTSADQVRWAKELDEVMLGNDIVRYHFVRCPSGIDAFLERMR